MLARHSCQTWGVSEHHDRLRTARLYLVCGEAPDAFLHAALRGGVDIVQLRCKDAEDNRILAAGARVAAACSAHGALFILNDRPDLAAELGADGVHVGQDDASVASARGLVGHDRIVGLSTHSPDQIDAAAQMGVDYIGVGPVYATPTKPGRSPVGLDLVRYAAGRASMPWFAIGGVDADTVSEVAEAGARRIAVVRALTQSADLPVAARTLLDGLRERAGAGA